MNLHIFRVVKFNLISVSVPIVIHSSVAQNPSASPVFSLPFCTLRLVARQP